MEETPRVELVRSVQRQGTRGVQGDEPDIGDVRPSFLSLPPFLPHPCNLSSHPSNALFCNSGNYDSLRDYATFGVVDAIKQQRTRKLQGLRMSWKLHKVKEQSVVCAREQELFKKDEKIAQMVVRFVTEQVRLRFLALSPCSNETYVSSSPAESRDPRPPRTSRR
jgi:hypothetical protein